MSNDIIIRGGTIVDGSGKDAVTGDIAIKDGVITEVGEVSGTAAREIDAEGQTVTPGFVDLHTHLDAQIGWDPAVTPVSWHGVTTALLGNCGVTFAPCKPDERVTLASMMETVEDIPQDAIMTGLPWDWENYGEYLDSIERLGPGINIAGLVGHCAVRFYVMGERAVEEDATEDEIKQMTEVVARSVDAGAVGFSTNRFEPHKLADGRSIPGTFAQPEELMSIAQAIGERDALMQAVGADFGLIHDLAKNTGSRFLFSAGVGADPKSGKWMADQVEKMNEGGLDITGISQPRGTGFVLGLQSMTPLGHGAWKELRDMSFEERQKAIQDDGFVAKLVEFAKGPDVKAPHILDSYWMGTADQPEYVGDKSLMDMAEEAGEHWSETYFRLMRETNGMGSFTFRMFNKSIDALADLFKSDRVFPSLGDAGAHVSQIMDAGWATFVLSYWVRERGLYSLEEGVRRITSAPARVMGLKDRGLLAPGLKADINVFDAGTVGERQPEIVNDFPGGAPRYIQRSSGYKATIVNGVVSLEDGELTGDRAGTVLRHKAA